MGALSTFGFAEAPPTRLALLGTLPRKRERGRTDERYLWYRPTMAALRALKKIAASEGRGRQKVVAAPRCLRINGENFCQ